MKSPIVFLSAIAVASAAVTTTLPKSAGVEAHPTAIPVKTVYDGGMKRFERDPPTCGGQQEKGEKDAMFILESGATLSNVILGASQAEGVHCRGTCTLNNVWWEDVCEDAATFKQPSGTSFVNGGGAFKAKDKILQFNGRGTVQIKDFYANTYGKLIRTCGNCPGNGGPRHITISGSMGKGGGELCGINSNYGDTCRVSNSCQDSNHSCTRYEGNDQRLEPPTLGSGHDGVSCFLTNFSRC
ncbi:hypothetical protein D7B24_002521 [Verticillium nonalfalfae]|uniref:Pectate lyase n=1 Tax=Verticillium nonalfalfae TaxID=1051616 RepID=A0A3M9XYD3_9PEZI|nr:uncharacterized protein D7B24_002521 [Verticillium nonalfalfae]RNJ53041.1 hypothetical protein D7B24_002521 [Verticillium nonalfalfae]